MKNSTKLVAALLAAAFAVSAQCATPKSNASASSGRTTSSNIDKGLVAYWPLNGNANDASGNGNDGVVEGATLTTDRNGKANSAYHFDGGKRDTIRVPSSPSLKSISSAATVSAWIKPEKWDNSWVIVFSKGENTRQYGLFAKDTGTLYIHDSFRNDAPNASAQAPEGGLKLGVWQHVAVVYDGSKTIAYVNGKAGEPKNTSGKFVPNDEDLFFGRDDYVDKENFTGDIDELRVYNRALSAAEIAALAGTSVSNSGGGSKTSTTTATSRSGKLLCHLTFDDHSNPLKAKVGQDAIVRTGKDTPASGLGDARWESYIKDGALRIPTGTHLAVPVPAALADRPGHPYTVEMKVRFPEPRDKWCCLMNMPAGNYMDAMAFLTTDADKRVVLKASGRIEGTGTFRLGEWNDFCFQFGEKTTRVFVDGKELFRQDYSLAGSRADCSKAGGYILFAADDNGEDNPMALADVKIYDGVVAPSSTSTGGNTTQSGGGNNGGAKSGNTTTQSNNGGNNNSNGGTTGKCLCRLTFNDRANPLRAEGVANAVVRKNQTERVSGMGEVKWLNESGDGAVAIPKNYHIALPVPAKLARAPGLPWTMRMKLKFDSFSEDGIILNMPADNTNGCLLYANKNDARIAVKQYDKSPGTAMYGGSGFVAGKIHTLQLNFDTNKTRAFLDGKQIFSNTGKLAGSYADCAKAGGYFLIRGDDDGEGGTVTFYDVAVYEGSMEPQYFGEGESGGNTTTQSGGNGSGTKSGGLVAHWPLDGNANDSSGNGNHGKVEGATLTTDRNGKANSAYHFDGGKRDTIRVPSSPSLKSISSAATVSAWIKPEKWDGSWLAILSKGDDVRQYGLVATHPNRLDLNDQVDVVAATPGDLKLNAWQHVAVTYDGSKAIAYLNGKAGEPKNTNGKFTQNDQDLFFGRDYQGARENYTGDIDDMRIYNRALSAAEIAALAGTSVSNSGGGSKSGNTTTQSGGNGNSGGTKSGNNSTTTTQSGGNGNSGGTKSGNTTTQSGNAAGGNVSGGLVAYWPLDGNANDASGNGNDGVVEGATLTTDRNGKANSAYHFDAGKRDTIRVSSSPSLKNITSTATVAAWIKPEKWYNGWIIIFAKGQKVRQYGHFADANGMLYMHQPLTSNAPEISARVPERLKLGVWQHVAFVYDGSKTIAYVNGKAGEPKSTSAKFTPNDEDLYFARDEYGRTEDYTGDIDEVRIYNRALSADEVMQLYNGTGGSSGGGSSSGGGANVAGGSAAQGKYMVIDLSGGPNAAKYPVSILNGMPRGGWTDSYKTTKLVLRQVPAGKFTMGSPANEKGRYDNEIQREVSLTKPFYIGVFEVTQKQYELVMGSNPSRSSGDKRPVECMHPDKMRGNWRRFDWPKDKSVDPDSFIGRLRAKTGMNTFDLPTEAQWEYACRAGTKSALHSGKNLTDETTCQNVAEVARYRHNIEKGQGGCNDRHTVVGTFNPNAWGIYDMLGNVWEYCLDWYDEIKPGSVTDPQGPETGPARVTRGGSWYDGARLCRSAFRNCDRRYDGWDNFGFRIACSSDAGATSSTTGTSGGGGTSGANSTTQSSGGNEAGGNVSGGLVAYWPLDGNANDASGNKNNGKVEGATLTTDRNGKANSAYHFDGGKRDTIRVPSSPSLKSISSAATVSAWIKPEKWDNGWIIIFAKGQKVRQYGHFANANDMLYMHQPLTDNAPEISARVPERLKLGVWQHVAVVYDGSKTIAYVNGKAGEPNSTSGKFVPNDEDLFFGRDDYGNKENFTGDIDELRIYNRALSAAEIQKLYGGAPKTSTTTATSRSGNLLCHLTFDDHSNPLKAKVGQDAIVREGKETAVAGLGNARWEAYQKDGALRVPNGTHIAVPVPDALTDRPGHPYSIEMKIRFPEPRDKWCCLMNMPAGNYLDAMSFLEEANPGKRIVLKASGRVTGSGTFKLGEWNTFHFQFDKETTRVFVDGKEFFKQDYPLAGSRADASAAGGYFLFAADDNGDENQASIADIKIYDGVVAPSGTSTGGSTGGGSSSGGGGNTTQNDGGGCFYPGSGRDGELKQAPAVKMPDEKRAPDYLNPDGTPVGSPSTKTNTPTTKTNTPTTKTNDPNGKPSAKVQDMLNSLYDDDGSKSDEDKIAELKYYVESHMDEPGIGRIVDRIEDMARQIDDEDTLRWVEDIRKKLAGEVTDDNDRDGNGNGDGDDGSKETDHLGRKDGEGDEGGNNNDEEKKKDNADEDIIEDEGATKDEIVAAAEAAMKDLSVFVPSDEKIEAIDAAFKKMPKIRRAKTESSRRPIEPLMSDAFFDSLPPRQLIAHFRELMRDILGPMTPDTQKRFEKEFAAAISYPTDEVVEWVRKAAPIISEMQRLKAGMMQEFVDFDSTFGEACIAQNFDYYDGAYNRISDASRTVCAMEAIKARMEELFKMYLALGPMPNAAEQQKQDAAEYKAATKAVKDYIIMGDEVSDDIKDIEGVYHADQCSYRLTVSQDSKEPENEGYLTESPTDGHTHAPWRMEKLYIKPITQFGGEDGLVFVYIYGEDPPDGSGETEYDTRVLEAWAVPDGEGGLLFFGGGDNLIAINKETREEFLKDKDIRKEYLHPECIHLKPTKDSDGRPILLFKHHWLHDDGKWKVSPGSSEIHEVYRDKTYTYSTIVFRKSSVEDYQELPEAELEQCAATLTTGKTAEEKAREAGRLYPEALKRFEKEREQYTKEAAALGDTYDTLPTIYDLYFVISGAPEIELGFDYDKTNPMEGNAPVAVYSDKYPGTDDVYLNMANDRSEVQPPQDYKDRWFVWALMACEEYLGRLDLFGFSHTKKWDISICGGKDCGLDTTPEKKVKVDSASVDFKANWTCPFPTVVRVIEGTGPVAFDIAVETKNSQHDRKIPNPVTGYMVYYGWNDRTVYSTNCLEISSASGGSGRLEAKLDIDYPGDDGFFENLHVDGTNQLHFTVYRGIEGKDYETSALYRSDAVYSATCDYKLMYLDEEQAEALAAKLGESLGEILTPPEEDSDIRDELMQKVEDAKKAQEEQDATIAFHKANIEFIDKRVASLKEEISKEKDPARKDALQFQVICAESDKLYEQDRIRAEQTGVWQPSRTPFDEMCIMQVRESAMREIAEINAANKARKRAEAIADKLPTKAQQDKAYEMINNIITNDPNDYEKLSKLGDIMRDQYMNYLEYDRQMAAAEDAYWSKKLQYAENTKLACDITLSLCGGAGGYAKAIEATYVCVTSYKEGGFTNAFKKTVCTIWDCVDVASEVIDGIVEDGWKGALKKGEISFAMHYGIPYLLGKMKGPPDGTGCYNSFDVDRLNKWNPAPRLATRKPPRVADVNAAFFENNYATQKISNYIEKKNLYEAVKDYTKHSSETVLKAKHEFYKAVGEVNVNPMAKAKLKYDPSYNKLGISKNFAADVDDINEIATTRTMNMMVDQGYSRQELVSFRNDSSIGSVGMDADFGLKEYKDMKITLNGKPVTKHQWAEATQKQLNKDYFEITGQSAERSFVNVTYSGDAESYKNLAILKASKDPEAMRHIMQTSSLSDVQQIMDVTKYKANTMLDIKGHPKLIGQYEAIRGTGKDLETKLIPAIKGEIDAIKKESMALVKVGKALPKAQEIKLEKLQAAHTRYKKVEAACKRVGELKVPLYEANEYIRTATGGKEIPEVLDDIEMLMMSMNLMKPKTNLMKIK